MNEQRSIARYLSIALIITAAGLTATSTTVQQTEPQMVAGANLGVRLFASGLVTPTSIAFPGPSELFVLEKDTGKVQWFVNGEFQSTVLDLAVNKASERGLLGIALHPEFPANPGVYLF